jgi:comEA protein
MGNSRRSKTNFEPNVSNVLFLVLVAATGFIVGSQYRTNSPTTPPSEEVNPAPNEVIAQLQSALSDPQAAPDNAVTQTTEEAPMGLVNINTASASELDTLPGIGPSYAKAIIDYRTKNGPFVRLEDIQQVKGIGPKTFEKLKNKITL